MSNPVGNWVASTLCLGMIAAGISGCRGGNQEMSADTGPFRLEAGRPSVPRDLAGGGVHVYLVRVEAGQYVRLTADQRGIDVKLVLRVLDGTPEGKVVREVDSPNGDWGPETVSDVALATGDYQAEVKAGNKAEPGQYEIRLDVLREATDQDRTRVAAEGIFHEGERLRREKEWPSALERYERALKFSRSIADREGEAESLYRMGWMHERLENLTRAIELYDQAIELYRGQQDSLGEAAALNRRGRLQHDLGLASESITSHQRALELFRGEGKRKGMATSLNNLGNAYAAVGKGSLAIAAYEEALPLFQALGEKSEEGKVLLNVGDLYLTQDKRREARDSFEAALRIFESENDRAWTATTLSNLGELEQRDGRLEEARAHLIKAVELQRELGNTRGRAISLASLGTTWLKLKEFEKSLAANEEALGIFRMLKDSRGEGIVLSNLGRYHQQRGEHALSIQRLREALAIFERTGDREGMALSRHAIAQALAGQGDLEAARQELEASLGFVESLRTEAPGLGFRASYFASKQHYWDLYIDILMQMHDRNRAGGFDVLALHASERRRARSLLDALAQTRSDVKNGIEPDLLRQVREVQERINFTERRRLDLLTQEANEGDVAALERDQRTLLARLEVLREQIRQRSPRFAELTDPEPMDAKAIQKGLLDVNTLLLVYSLGESRSVLWTISPQKVTSHVLEDRAQIESLARRFHELLQSREESAEAARERTAKALAGLILQPAAERIRSFPRILVVGDGALLSIPFAALPAPGVAPNKDGEAVLMVEKHEIVYLPSASVLGTLRRDRGRGRQPGEMPRIAVIADPVFSAADPRVRGGGKGEAEPPGDLTRSARSLGLDDLHRLPHTREEAEAILAMAAMVKARDPIQAFDFDAAPELLTGDRLRDCHILHIATHSLLSSHQPELSGIVFSLVDPSGRPRDGFLRLHEIYNLDLPANLVVLSACQTGVGKEVRGEGMMGITRGFMHAGARQVVVSLWKVDDRSTAELMKRFYHQILEEGQYTAKALQKAQISMLRDPQWSHPRHWSGFIFQGDFRVKPNGDIEEEDVGEAGTAVKAKNDMPPPKVADDDPPL